jgi:hypothetical protein
MARKSSPTEAELRRRLRVAHRTASDTSAYAGRLLARVEYLERAIAARDLFIEQLKEQVSNSELLCARIMRD